MKCKDIITIHDAYNIISMEFHQLKKTHKKQSRAGMTNLHSPYDQMSMNLTCIFYEFLKTFFRFNFSAVEIKSHLSLDITISGIIGMRVSIIVVSHLKYFLLFRHSSLGNLLNMTLFYRALMNQHLLNPY